jgi:ribose transport system substrate-binding protein
MRLKPLVTALCAGALLAAAPFAQAKELKSIGVTVGDLANPFFVQITKGAELEARKLAGDNVKVTLVSSGYDLGQQVAQIDNFIAAKVDMIILNAADSKGIGPAVNARKMPGSSWWRLTLRRKGQMPPLPPITPRRGDGL